VLRGPPGEYGRKTEIVAVLYVKYEKRLSVSYWGVEGWKCFL